jgi:serine/threonine-protein kinase HipA
MIAKTLLLYGGGLNDLKEMARRLALNVLLGNGDAHLKNWSLIYDNPVQPRLAPAYDLVSTVAYTKHDTSIALNMGGIKDFTAITLGTFKKLFERIGITDRTLDDLLEETRRTGQTILTAWEEVYERTGVPPALIERLKAHQAGLALVPGLQAGRSGL